MAARRPEGTALLVAGYGALGALDASALHTLGQIGEALLATGAAWQIRRLATTAGSRYAPDPGGVKQHPAELCGEPARAAAAGARGGIARGGTKLRRRGGAGAGHQRLGPRLPRGRHAAAALDPRAPARR